MLLSLAAGLFATPAWAEKPIELAQRAEMDRVRAEVAGEIHLSAFDLVDELVYGWSSEPVFPEPTPVVLAGVSVPVGLGTGLQALIENHLSAVLGANPTSNVQLAHCPQCTAMVVHSGPEGTVVTRGIDNPRALADLGAATGQHALFVDIEAEGAWLVLRARITRLTPALPIVWSHTLSTSANTPALLREPKGLKSAAEAREEYIDALHGRGPIAVPLRVTIRSYKRPPPSNGGIGPPPFVWLQSGVEIATTDAHAWTTSIVAGFTWAPDTYQGVLGQVRINRLLTGRVRSRTKPNLHAFVGAAVITVWGPATQPFQENPITSDDILALADMSGPRFAFGAFHAGLDLRVGNRIGMSTFLEMIPHLAQSPNLGDYVRVGSIGFPAIGTEVTLWF